MKENERMSLSLLAGKPVPKDMLMDIAQVERPYFEVRPDPDDARRLVSFGTSGHRWFLAARVLQ
jgi:phosphoglucomutase